MCKRRWCSFLGGLKKVVSFFLRLVVSIVFSAVLYYLLGGKLEVNLSHWVEYTVYLFIAYIAFEQLREVGDSNKKLLFVKLDAAMYEPHIIRAKALIQKANGLSNKKGTTLKQELFEIYLSTHDYQMVELISFLDLLETFAYYLNRRHIYPDQFEELVSPVIESYAPDYGLIIDYLEEKNKCKLYQELKWYLSEKDGVS